MKNLIVIGDSFCVHRDPAYPNSWVSQLGRMTNCKVYGAGFAGRSWWKQHKWFNLNLKDLPAPKETGVVWCHTSAHRLPCDNETQINPWVVRGNKEDLSKFKDSTLLKLARDFYQSPLYVEKFYTWAMAAWWRELAMTLSPYKKVIHLFGFHDYGMADSNRLALVASNSVVVMTPSLGSLSKCDSKDFHYGHGDTRMNHLNEHNNHQLAVFVKNTLDNADTNTTVEIDNLDQWKFEIPFDSNLKHNYGFFIKDPQGIK